MIKEDAASKQIELLHLKVKYLVKESYTDERIITELKKNGIEEHYARLIIQNIYQDLSDKRSFLNSMIMGSFYIGAGLLINVFSYKFAVSSNSLIFYLFWGIIVLGIITIIKGFILYRK